MITTEHAAKENGEFAQADVYATGKFTKYDFYKISGKGRVIFIKEA